MMKNLKIAALFAGVLLTSVSGMAMAKPMKMAASTLKCPVCSMPMPTAKSSMMTVPVYAKSAKKVYYCCPECKAGKAGTAYMKKNKKPMPV